MQKQINVLRARIKELEKLIANPIAETLENNALQKRIKARAEEFKELRETAKEVVRYWDRAELVAVNIGYTAEDAMATRHCVERAMDNLIHALHEINKAAIRGRGEKADENANRRAI